MLRPHELSLTRKGESIPCSLVLYGLNSSGKTSFVDGLEWFLSRNNKIDWLKREEAEERAYPHQEAKDGDSFVEIEFNDSEKQIAELRKTFNHNKITQPDLSNKDEFENIYKSYIIKPHLRYLEVIDFVYNSTGQQKYQKLASWMGFESEMVFQEKIALKIVPELKWKEKQLADNIAFLEKHLSQLIGSYKPDESGLIGFCNEILRAHKVEPAISTQDLWKKVESVSKLKISSAVAIQVDKLTEIEVSLVATGIDDSFLNSVKVLQEGINALIEDAQVVQKIDVIDLYNQALNILSKSTEAKTNCPVCGTLWEREKLLAHIRDELALLNKVKEKRDEIIVKANTLKELLKREQETVGTLISRYDEAQKIISSINYDEIKVYQSALTLLDHSLKGNILTNGVQCKMKLENISAVNTEKSKTITQVNTERVKIQPSQDELKLGKDIEKLRQVKEKWVEIQNARDELKFFSAETEKFITTCNALVKLVQENIKSRFGEISERIGKYFSILRSDKDIKKIEILLNEERGRAIGRSAEIQLSYYNITVKPAYKVLSESLLNSLGLAVYFTCVKQFNKDCKFIVLDDIMNSLDVENRDTLLDIIEQDFGDYQVILFTHDTFWFQKIKRRFPGWISKKIMGWDYRAGSKIDFARATKEEIEELLLDPEKIEDAGFKFGKHIEGILNELCENLEAEVKHRYLRSDPPSMEELFDALYKRFESKLGQNPIIQKVSNAKKYEPLMRNFTGHPRGNYPSSISPIEVRRAMDEWFILEKDLWCTDCRRYVKYDKDKNSIECRCGKTKLIRGVATTLSPIVN